MTERQEQSFEERRELIASNFVIEAEFKAKGTRREDGRTAAQVEADLAREQEREN